jgi:hypothetical protein
MRSVGGGMLLGLGLLALGTVGFTEAQTQRTAPPERTGVSSDLQALSFDSGEGRQQITILDPRQRVLAVYHVDRVTGALTLRSVRHVEWDLQIEDFNSEKPTPREVRQLTQQVDRSR